MASDYEWLLEYGKMTPESSLELLGTMQPTSKFGELFQYSNLMAAAAGYTAAHVLYPDMEVGAAYDRAMQSYVFDPLGMRDTRYLPPRSWLARIAPTEVDTTWRHRLVRGAVHDENAASMGGVSGHAGLFSTAPDLVRFVQFLMNGGRPDAPTHRRTDAPGRPGAAGAQLVSAATVALFTRADRPAFSSRALGWDTPSEHSSAGDHLSPHAFGHTGFTGTSIWVDPDEDLFVVLLTNRVHPTRNNDVIREVRRRVADLAVEAAGGKGADSR